MSRRPGVDPSLIVEAEPHFEWDTATWSRAVRAWGPDLLDREATDHPVRCLEVGARRAGLSAWLASRGHHCVASDRVLPERPNHPGDGRVEPAVLDLLAAPLEQRFDVIVVKSVLGSVRSLHGEGGLQKAQANLVTMLADGGAVWFAENLAASPVHRFVRRRFVAWADRWHYFTPGELRSAMAPGCEVDTFATTGLAAAFGRTESQRDLLARVDSAVESVVPEAARYVGYGVARKLTGVPQAGADSEGRTA